MRPQWMRSEREGLLSTTSINFGRVGGGGPEWGKALNRCRDSRCAGLPVGGVGSELRARL
jgi:hypothetical protein